MNFEEEYLHGSPLDHKHCVTCIRRTCKVRADDATSCPLVDCPRGCASRYHGCKEAEHQALCSEERVPCINNGYGCPLLLPRKRLSQHLVVCPASVVFCSAEWNRSPMDLVKPGGKADVLLTKTYTDCGQLDTAQAMRDHRALVDMLLAPPETRRSLRNPQTQIYPAAPIGRPSPSPESESGLVARAAADVANEEEVSGWDWTQPWLSIQKERYKTQSQLYEASQQTASSLTSTLTYISDQMDARDGATGETSGGSTVQGASSVSSTSTTDRGGVIEGCSGGSKVQGVGPSSISPTSTTDRGGIIEGCSGGSTVQGAGPSSISPTSTTDRDGIIEGCSGGSTVQGVGSSASISPTSTPGRDGIIEGSSGAGPSSAISQTSTADRDKVIEGFSGADLSSSGQMSTTDKVDVIEGSSGAGLSFSSSPASSIKRDGLNSALTPTQHLTASIQRCSDESGLAKGSVDWDEDMTGRAQGDKQQTAVCDRQALNSMLSVSMEIECITKYQPKPVNTYTFLCAQETRRQEFPHHFHAVHNRILPDLNSWMEQRCPLAYLGCPFSFRRFRPASPAMTLCHSWLLDSYGVTALPPHADPSHRTPPHLLPTRPETATVVIGGLETAATENSVCPMPSAVSQDGKEARIAATVSQQTQPAAHSSASGDNNTSSQSQLACQNGQKSDSSAAESGALASDSLAATSDSTDTTRLSTPDKDGCPSKEESFSALLDGINLEQDPTHPVVPSSQKRTKYQDNGLHPPTPADVRTEVSAPRAEWGQGREERERRTSVESDVEHGGADRPATLTQCPAGERERTVDGGGRQSSHGPPSVPISSPPACSSQGDCKQVIYTATGPNTCVRVDWVPVTPPAPQDDTGANMQLCDLPVEILRHVAQFLDSFSLSNLSLVSRRMRDLCCSLLQDRGMVSLLWGKQRQEGKVSWQVTGKRWSFSTCFERVDGWSFTGPNPISDHLVTCAYNQDRFHHLAKFSIIPLIGAPMDAQIRDMLQERINRRSRSE